MWSMAMSSVSLFLQGKLFAEAGKVYRQVAIGAAVTAIVMIVLALVGLPVWIAAVAGGLTGGGLQPYLFRDLKYR